MSLPKVRKSQVVTTYGPGALVDLPDRAVIIAGLEHWKGDAPLVSEPRLLANLRGRMHLPFLELRSPPVPEREDDTGIGITAYQFPEWYLAQFELRSQRFGRSRPLVHRTQLVKGRYAGEDPTGKRKRKDWPVVPLRFVQACPNGHVDDIPWSRLVHGEGITCGGQLWLDERGTTGDLAELFVRCDGCERKALSLVQLERSGEKSLLGHCNGKRIWLGPAAAEKCVTDKGKPGESRLLVRHASNAYFPVIERAISIPDHNERVRRAVDAVWDDFLSVAADEGDVRHDRKKKRVHEALDGLTDAEVWAECERRRSGAPAGSKGLKEVELDTFLAVQSELGEDKPEGDFYARRRPLDAKHQGSMARFERVVLVHRLREVVVETGFTRFESRTGAVGSDMDIGVGIASLAQEPRWLPAIENRGEGIFLSLDPDAVRKWLEGDGVKRRAKQLLPGFTSTEKQPVSLEQALARHVPYVLLHSLSHLLLTAVALDCGYAAASLRERIYVRDGAYGLLLYTGTPDAEGTLGGLVAVGRKLEKHLAGALEMGQLCSNDPVCAQHRPSNPHEGRLMHGAACHGCVLIAEPSCERRNELLDRALVVPTVDGADAAFFQDLG